MEIWDAYLENGALAGRDLIRGQEIPQGLFHLVCEVLVRHRDGSYLLMQRDFGKETHPGEWEASAGGSAVKGEDTLSCVHRELLEETGIVSDRITYLCREVYKEKCTIYDVYLCETDCGKDSVTLQAGETIAYKWIPEEAFIRFVNTEMLKGPKRRFTPYFREIGYIQ